MRKPALLFAITALLVLPASALAEIDPGARTSAPEVTPSFDLRAELSRLQETAGKPTVAEAAKKKGKKKKKKRKKRPRPRTFMTFATARNVAVEVAYLVYLEDPYAYSYGYDSCRRFARFRVDCLVGIEGYDPELDFLYECSWFQAVLWRKNRSLGSFYYALECYEDPNPSV